MIPDRWNVDCTFYWEFRRSETPVAHVLLKLTAVLFALTFTATAGAGKVTNSKVCDSNLRGTVSASKDGVTAAPLDGPIGPLQSEAGFAEVSFKENGFLDEAKLSAASKGEGLRHFILEIAKREAGRGVEAVIDPDGVVRPVDGHHKILAIRALLRHNSIPLAAISWKFEVADDHDFRGKSWKRYARFLSDRRLGLLSEAQENESQASKETAVERIQRLPPTFDAMSNSPMRSSTGRLFDLLGLEGAQFSVAAQFTIGRELLAMGVRVDAGDEYSPAIMGRILDLVLYRNSSAGILRILSGLAIPEFKVAVSQSISQGQLLYLRIREELAKGQQSAFDEEIDEVEPGEGEADSLEARAAEIFTSLSTSLAKPVLPKIAMLPKTEDDFAAIYVHVKKSVLAQVDVPVLRGHLDNLRDRDHQPQNRDRKYLKNARKALLLLRANYRLLSHDQAAPKRMDGFVSELGELNDLFLQWTKQGGGSKARRLREAMAEKSKWLLRVLDSEKNIFDQNFQPVSAGDFVQDQLRRLAWIEAAIAKSDPDLNKTKMTVNDYHILRKRLREYMALFLALDAFDRSFNDDLISSMLMGLNSRMGQVKDGMIFSTKSSTPLDDPTAVDPISLDLIQRFTALMRAALAAP